MLKPVISQTNIIRCLVISIIGLGACIGSIQAESLCVVSYNVENLFHPKRDSINTDSLFTPEGERKWSYTRYYRKVENVARVLTNIGQWDGIDIAGLQEVEDAACLKRLCYTLRAGEYGHVHYDSPDRRGIDVALLYKKARIDTLRTQAIPVALDSGQTTRDILYVCAIADKRDTLHLMVCHLPSQLGGSAETAWKRHAAKQVLQQTVDSILRTDAEARIIVMGDMNSAPSEDLRGMSNRMIGQDKRRAGTHKHQGQWTCLDQFYTSATLDSTTYVQIYDAEWLQETDEKYLGLKPLRTYNGFHYQEGFSDHLPIVLRTK